MFEDRGDPWVSPREGLEGFGRNLNTEDPDLDRYTLAKRAKGKVGKFAKVSTFDPRASRSVQAVRRTDIVREMHRKMGVKPIKVVDASRADSLAPSKAKVRVDCFIVYSVTKDGAKNEHNIAKREDAERKFKQDARRFRRGSLKYLEFWHPGGVLHTVLGKE